RGLAGKERRGRALEAGAHGVQGARRRAEAQADMRAAERVTNEEEALHRALASERPQDRPHQREQQAVETGVVIQVKRAPAIHGAIGHARARDHVLPVAACSTWRSQAKSTMGISAAARTPSWPSSRWTISRRPCQGASASG